MVVNMRHSNTLEQRVIKVTLVTYPPFDYIGTAGQTAI
jgi:hypothetical protein